MSVVAVPFFQFLRPKTLVLSLMKGRHPFSHIPNPNHQEIRLTTLEMYPESDSSSHLYCCHSTQSPPIST